MPEDPSPKNSTIIEKIFSFLKCKHKYFQSNQEELKKSEKFDIYKYDSLKSEDIMIPRSEIIAVDYNSTLTDIEKIFLKTRYSRLPVFKETLDNVIGFISIKDALPYLLDSKKHSNFKLKKIIHNLLVISPSMKIFALLEKMRQTRTHIALVVDELGGADGLITIEDLIGKIVGKIEDEHTEDELELKKLDDRRFEASGRIKIEVLENKLDVHLNKEEIEEYDTVGGLILSISGSVPEKGAKISHPSTGLVFEIIESDPRRIKKVIIHQKHS